MKKSTQSTLILAGILVVLGLLICLLVSAIALRNPDRLHSLDSQQNRREESRTLSADEITGLIINEVSFDIELLGSDTDEVSINYTVSDYYHYDIEVDKQGILNISFADDGDYWQQNWLSFFDNDFPKLVISLPTDLLNRVEINAASSNIRLSRLNISGPLAVNTASGDLDLADCRINGELSFDTASGNFSLHGGELAAEMRLETVSGEMELDKVQGLSGDWQLQSTSGDVSMEDSSCGGQMRLETSSGEVELENIRIHGDLRIDSNSGDLELNRVAAENLRLKTTSGDIEGVLLGQRTEYRTSGGTVSGELRLPQCSGSKYTLEVSATSGDIELEMLDR